MPWLGRDEGYQNFGDGTALFEGTIWANRRHKKKIMENVSQLEVHEPRAPGRSGN